MALLILVSTTGFSISQHFCMGELSDLALIGKLEPCEMAMEKEALPPCHTGDKSGRHADSFTKEPCCKDHSATVTGQELPTVLKKSDNLLPSVKFLAAFTNSFVYGQTTVRTKLLPYTVYRPPLIERDIPVLIQSFLI